MFIWEFYVLFQRKPFLSRRNVNETLKSVIINGGRITRHLGYNAIVSCEQTMGIASLNRELPGKSTAVVDFTHYVHKSAPCFAYPVGFTLEFSALFYLTVLYGHLLDARLEKKRHFPHFRKLSQVAR
jgi:hypothetical protein